MNGIAASISALLDELATILRANTSCANHDGWKFGKDRILYCSCGKNFIAPQPEGGAL